jgi:hypothetical protein
MGNLSLLQRASAVRATVHSEVIDMGAEVDNQRLQ